MSRKFGTDEIMYFSSDFIIWQNAFGSSVYIFSPQLPSIRIFVHDHERKFYLNAGKKCMFYVKIKQP